MSDISMSTRFDDLERRVDDLEQRVKREPAGGVEVIAYTEEHARTEIIKRMSHTEPRRRDDICRGRPGASMRFAMFKRMLDAGDILTLMCSVGGTSSPRYVLASHIEK